MRRRAISGVPGLSGTPFERLEQFARMILRVSKAESDKESKKYSGEFPLPSRLGWFPTLG